MNGWRQKIKNAAETQFRKEEKSGRDNGTDPFPSVFVLQNNGFALEISSFKKHSFRYGFLGLGSRTEIESTHSDRIE